MTKLNGREHVSDEEEELDEETETKEPSKKRKKQGNQPTKKARYDNTSYHAARRCTKDVDVSAWREVLTPPPVLEALAELGFSQPTEIQVL